MYTREGYDVKNDIKFLISSSVDMDLTVIYNYTEKKYSIKNNPNRFINFLFYIILFSREIRNIRIERLIFMINGWIIGEDEWNLIQVSNTSIDRIERWSNCRDSTLK